MIDQIELEQELNISNLIIIKLWACQWTMKFDPDGIKQGIDVCFSRKIARNNRNPLSLNQSQIKMSESHKRLQSLKKDIGRKSIKIDQDEKTLIYHSV